MTKLTELGTRLSKWAKKEKGAREYRSNVLNSRMISLSSKEISDEVLAEMTEIRLKIWASYRQKNNRIKGLENEAGRWVNEATEISTIATDYFKNMFSKSVVSSSDDLLSTIRPCITKEFNENLRKEFQAAEF
ncbi:hypothetical protein GOBAR_AA36849 [Gossypium barbadense]|uniref:Uncharacterized protein n=1 Tax=Gossypium barbadense TaxID=3634 RepID=A0A2P5VYE2_GOSBA|nr:hypothetical protein GOBAR_AA36849 [Gossypium barbadense]